MNKDRRIELQVVEWI